MEGSRSKNPVIWRSFGALHPRRGVEHIGRLVRDWFPAAWAGSGPPLPATPAFQHMFLGLCMLADWIGSDEIHFPFCAEPRADYMQTARHKSQSAISEIGLNIDSQRDAFHALSSLPKFGVPFGIPNATPNPIQKLAIAVPLDERLVIIESVHEEEQRLREGRITAVQRTWLPIYDARPAAPAEESGVWQPTYTI